MSYIMILGMLCHTRSSHKQLLHRMLFLCNSLLPPAHCCSLLIQAADI
jgi:hypothetical protein